MKKCPYCAEEIQDEAIVCRYCGRDLHTPEEFTPISPCPRQSIIAEHKVGYIEQNLIPGEHITLRAKLSWAMFVVPTIVTVVGVILILSNSNNMGCLTELICLVGVPFLLQAIITYNTTEFAVTDKRIIA